MFNTLAARAVTLDNPGMRYLSAALTVAVMALVADQVSALECFPIPLKTSLAEAEIVLLGQVESARYATVVERPNSASHYIVTVRVKKLWKGSTPTTIELHQPWIGGGMGLDQHIGIHYLFFLSQLTPQRPLSDPLNSVTSGYRATECISKPASSSFDSLELGKSYPPTP